MIMKLITNQLNYATRISQEILLCMKCYALPLLLLLLSFFFIISWLENEVYKL